MDRPTPDYLNTTTSQLLEQLHDPHDDAVWGEFDARYRPILIRFAERLGLPPDEAHEVAQQSLFEFVRAYKERRYDREKGRLRSWIIGIAHKRIQDTHRARGRRGGWRGDSALANMGDSDHLTDLWEAEKQRSVLARALTELRLTSKTDPRTIRAFELFAIEGRPVGDVASECEMSSAEVYVAKHRVTQKLREIADRLLRLYSKDES